MRVLVVDDSRVFQRVIRGEMEAGGYQVDAVGDGAAGLEALSNTNYDLVTLDIEMPGMNGFEVCQAWRCGQGGASAVDIPVVFITGYDTHEGRLDGFDAGATEFHPKRFTPGELRGVVDRLLRGDRRFESMTVLAVDDSRTVRFMVRSVLGDLGCTMLMADSGEAALDLLDQHGDEIDLVVSDQLMPGIGGDDCVAAFAITMATPTSHSSCCRARLPRTRW
jgi:two-component system cell cycle response regulator